MIIDGYYADLMQEGTVLSAEPVSVDVSGIVRGLTSEEKRRVAAWNWKPIEDRLKETGALPENGYIKPIDRSTLAAYAGSLADKEEA